MAEAARARPKPTPETQHFWDGTREGELRLQRCESCAKTYFPPRPFCPSCGSTVYWQPQFRPGLVAIALGCFEESSDLVPSQSVYGDNAHSWLDLRFG